MDETTTTNLVGHGYRMKRPETSYSALLQGSLLLCAFLCLAPVAWGSQTPTTVYIGPVTNDVVFQWNWTTQYHLNGEAEGSGAVAPSDTWYDTGSNATVVATPAVYWRFSHWTGDTNGCGIADSVITAPMTQVRSIKAHFVPDPPAGPATRYVDDDSADPRAPYTNAAHAAVTIQDAVAVSFSNDLILVSAGLYDTDGRVVHGSMMNRVAIDVPITVRGVAGPTATVIKGAGPLGNGAVRCVYLGTNAVLEGFTLTNGHTRAAGDYVTEQNAGGVYCEPGAIVSNCIIAGSSAAQDGGGAFRGTITDCEFYGNSCLDDGAGACEATLLRCNLHHNHTDDEGGAMYGGTATACFMTDNTSAGSGGGAFLGTLRDCLIARNTADNSGGGTQESTLYNCTVVGNQAFAGGGVYGGSITNCIVWDNAGLIGPNWEPSGFASPPSHSCSTDLPDSDGNTTNNPAFVDAAGGNYRLLSSSPCIDAGTNAVVTTDVDLGGVPRVVFGTVDMGAYEFVYHMDDYDGDGLSNDQERTAGTDPSDPDSRLAVVSIATTGGVEIIWIGGTQALQIVEMKTNLLSTAPWVPIYTNEPPTDVTNTLTLPVSPTGAGFYRVRVEGE